MAQTRLGVPFRLVRASARVKDRTLDELERVVRLTLRATDGVFTWDEKVFAALAGDTDAAERATERIKDACARASVAATVQVIREPFPSTVEPGALRVIHGDVKIRSRAREEEMVVAPSGQIVVRSDLARLYTDVRQRAWEAGQRIEELEREVRDLQLQIQIARMNKKTEEADTAPRRRFSRRWSA